MKAYRTLGGLFLAVSLLACESGTETPGLEARGEPDAATAGDAVDLSPDRPADNRPTEAVEAGAAETLDATGQPELTEALPGEGLLPGPGEPGHPCTSGTECNEGYCIDTENGKQCTLTCEEECPFGWQCTLYSPSLPDQVHLCLPPFINLCRPCLTNADCFSGGGNAGQACVDYAAAGFFCGGPCEIDQDCPDGYACETHTDRTGKSLLQCVLPQGECACTKRFADEGAATTCYAENDWGRCDGTRGCMALGLTPCTAAEPAEEACDGDDNDCDGEADEGLASTPCLIFGEFGNCPGSSACEDGEIVCVGEEAKKETCDGEDNDCDGQIDDGFPDTDADGMADCLEADKDGDGIADGLDNCPMVFNPAQADFDLDGLGDLCDLDDDNDMTADSEDCAAKDGKIFPGADELCDGKDNNCNYVVDEGFTDLDGDGFKDCIDDDDDNDGAADGKDCEPADPKVHAGAPELCDGKDNNCSGKIDEGWSDADLDGQADCLDDDQDGDGIANDKDNCPQLPNPPQDDLDKDGQGDLCDLDADGDGIPDTGDNCLGLKNPSQSDVDGDGVGDACDKDKDGDQFPDGKDNCPLVSNPDQKDSDADGIGDACESDMDGDGTNDTFDCAPLDPKIHPGVAELCDDIDNDCDFAVDEGFPDAEADGLKDCIDPDDDNDGDPDATDCMPFSPAIHHKAAEICDGIDNDCDEDVDENLGEQACGKGKCFHVQPACENGKTQWCDPYEGVAAESCDGADNDCNGLVDEGLGSTTCGLGICHHTVPNCSGGELQLCDPLEGKGAEECDGLDNDCDAKVDEDQPLLACGQGQCFHTQPSCLGGVEYECNPFEGASVEVCDGVDNDCNGSKDDKLGTVTCGIGPCEHTIPYCTAGKLGICNPLEGSKPEVCDGADNDCDGSADENLGILFCGLGLCAHAVAACVGGIEQDCDPYEGALEEQCDGLDNDCDGGIDEDLGNEICGKGNCLHSEVLCIGGQPNVCDPFKGAAEETCNGDDDDCDGTVDDGFPDAESDGLADCVDPDDDNDNDPDETDCAPTDPKRAHGLSEVCFNAIDEDCSGAADDTAACTGVSCSALLAKFPGLASGTYMLDVDGDGGLGPFANYCDMTDGGWTLILKADGAETLYYFSPYWTDTALLNEKDTTTTKGNAKYASFLHCKVTTMKGCLDGHCYTKGFNGAKTAREIFSGGADVQGGLPGFGNGQFWSTQPNCQHFGINTPYQYNPARFGYTANQEGDCNSNDTAIGLGISNNPDTAPQYRHGAGYLCLSSQCSKGNVNEGGHGLLWIK